MISPQWQTFSRRKGEGALGSKRMLLNFGALWSDGKPEYFIKEACWRLCMQRRIGMLAVVRARQECNRGRLQL